MKEIVSSALKDWIPIKLFSSSGIDHCRWLYVDNVNFTEPFFDQTILKCHKLPVNSKIYRPVSSLDILPKWSGQIESIAPTAFIFHVSRCGSTLISQLLGLNTENIVLAEVPFIDELLRSGHAGKTGVSSLVKAAISLYGAKRNEQNKRLFIKTDSWHIHFYKQLRELYPEVPFILLYRRPDEVIHSHQKKRGMQAVPGVIEPGVFNFIQEDIEGIGLDEYMAKVLETYFAAFISILKSDKLAIPVNYNEGAIPIVKKIAGATGITLTTDDIESMVQRSSFHAKNPGEVFEEPELDQPIPAYLEKSFELYRAVERIRIAGL